MELDEIFAPRDAARLERTLQRLAAYQLPHWAVTGGVAVEFHLARRGGGPITRVLHDIDFIVASFENIPPQWAQGLLLRHVHPEDPPGKTLLQGVQPDTEVRVDVFRAYGNKIERAEPVTIAGLLFRVVSFHDLVARDTRLNWDLVTGGEVAPKFARDFLRMIDFLEPEAAQNIWLEHRTPGMPESFAETVLQAQQEIIVRPHLLIEPVYSMDVAAVCARCRVVEDFPLAPASRILSILGYC